MNIRMKKMLSFFIVASMMVGLVLSFSGCWQDSDSDASSDNNIESDYLESSSALESTAYEDDDEEYMDEEYNADNSDEYVLETYTDENEISGGYTYNVTLKIGSWVKVTETETINNIWKSIGGSGSVPDINSFTRSNWTSGIHFGKGTSIMAFGTVAIEDTTQGDFSLADTSEYIRVDVYSSELTKNTLVDSYVQTSNGGSYLHSVEGRGNKTLHVHPKINKRTWGPVPFVICVNEAISPEYPDGKPNVMNATWSFGDNKFNVNPIWTKE